MSDYDYLFKVIIVGDGAVGKTALTIRFSEGRFQDHYKMTIGVDFAIKLVEIGGKKVKLQIWDTGGQERFSYIRPLYYKGAMSCIYVFDITNRSSFENLSKWVKEVTDYCGNVPSLLVANKCDLPDRAVAAEETSQCAKQLNCTYYEASAKTGENVDDLFTTMAKILMQQEGVMPAVSIRLPPPTPRAAPTPAPTLAPAPRPAPVAAPASRPAPVAAPAPRPAPVIAPPPTPRPAPTQRPAPVVAPRPAPTPAPRPTPAAPSPAPKSSSDSLEEALSFLNTDEEQASPVSTPQPPPLAAPKPKPVSIPPPPSIAVSKPKPVSIPEPIEIPEPAPVAPRPVFPASKPQTTAPLPPSFTNPSKGPSVPPPFTSKAKTPAPAPTAAPAPASSSFSSFLTPSKSKESIQPTYVPFIPQASQPEPTGKSAPSSRSVPTLKPVPASPQESISLEVVPKPAPTAPAGQIICPNCKKSISARWRYCTYCGTPIIRKI